MPCTPLRSSKYREIPQYYAPSHVMANNSQEWAGRFKLARFDIYDAFVSLTYMLFKRDSRF
jgi:hypothetical protein